MIDPSMTPSSRPVSFAAARPDRRRAFAQATLPVMLGALLLAAAAVPDVDAATAASGTSGLPDFQALVKSRGDAVVSVHVEKALQPASGHLPGGLPGGAPPPSGAGVGSGFVMSTDGYIVTNAHVVAGATGVSVTLADRRELPATLVGLDEATDIALLKVEATNLPAVELGDSDAVEVGQWVLAIGSPYGLEHTATQGIVSAVARNLPSGSYTPFIQTDAAVNPGNSGGPLFDVEGRVIGVNSQIYSRSGGYQGLSFSIPINVAKRVVEQLRTTGHASRGWLGVAIQDVDQALANAFGLDAPAGALVSDIVADGPAAEAGLLAGDIIMSVDGQTVTRSAALPSLVGRVAAGDTVALEVLRDGERTALDATIGEFAAQELAANGAVPDTTPTLGLVVEPLGDADREALSLEHGVRVVEVLPDGPAAAAGLQVGDVLVSVGGEPVDDAGELAARASALPEDESAAVLVQRGGRALFVALRTTPAHG